MAFNTDKLSYFHSFSKMPVQSGSNFADGTSLGNAINKSGHTVTASEVWASDIPYYGAMGSLDDIISKVQPYARKNDLCLVTTTGKTYIYDGEGNWSLVNADDATNAGKLVAGQLIKNANDDVVLLYHKGETLTNLTAANNANTNSANNAARLWTTVGVDGKPCASRLVEQFVGPTDKALNGLASVSYSPSIANGTLVAGTNYYDYCFSGTILWATARSTATVIDCFEYIGPKVSTVVDTVSAQGSTLQTVKDQVDTISDALGLGSEIVGTTLGSRVTDNETALRTLLGLEGDAKVVATESISTTAADAASTAISNATAALGTDGIFVDGQEAKLATVEGVIGYVEDYVAKNAAVTVKSGSYSKQITSLELEGSTGADVNVTVTGADATTGSKYTFAATVNKATVTNGAADSDDKLVTAGGAKALAEKAIETSLTGTTDGTIGKAIADVEGIINGVSQTVTDIQTDLASGATAQAIAAAKKAGDDAMEEAGKKVASVTGPTTGLVTVSGDKDVTITVSDTIATKTYADTAATNAVTTGLATGGNIAQAIATAKSGAEQTAATALSTARGEITTEIGTAVSGLETKLTTGEGSLGAKVAALETATGTTLPAAIEQSLTDAKKYTDDEIDKVEKSISDALTAHSEDIAKVEAAISSLSTSGFERIIVSELPATDIKLNAIYLVPMTTAEKELNGYAEYIYVGGTVTEGVVSGGKFEQIGTTKTDLTEYAKSVTVNGTKTPVTAATGDINIGKVASSVADGTVTGSISDTGVLTLTIDDATTSQKGAVQLDNTIADSTSETTAATPKAVKEYAQKALTVKDGRETVTENDVWGTTATLDSDGVLTVEHNWLTRGDFTQLLATPGGPTTKVIDNKVYHNDEFYCNVQTDRMTNMSNQGYGGSIFGYSKTLVEFSSDLSNLTNGHGMFCHESTLEIFDADMPSLRQGNSMFFDCSNLGTFENDLHSLKDATYMFSECSGLKSFTSDLPSLEKGMQMFQKCSNLTSFSSDLSSLTNGYEMFSSCYALKSFSSDLSNLTNCYRMFYGCSALDLFCGGDMSSLTTAEAMFQGDMQLTSFASDLSSLTYGAGMFEGCQKLTSFTSDLSSLTHGTRMFDSCKLDTDSVECIADTINDVTELEISYDVSKRIDISIGNETPNDEEDAAFKQMQDKGWDVYVNGSGFEYVPRTGEASLDETGETTVAPKPYWAKPIEVTEEEAEFVGEDGKFYQVVGGQFIYVNDPDTYGMFVSREDAIANMRLTKYVKPVEEETEAQA